MLPKILLFGDSILEMSFDISRGFSLPAALQNEFSRFAEVIVRGFGGYNTDYARIILPDILLDLEDVEVMLIFFGSNDSALNIQGVPIPRYTDNMRACVQHALDAGIKVIVVGPALHDDNLGLPDDPRSCTRNLEYSNAAARVAKEAGIPFINLWEAFRNAAGWKPGEAIPGTKGSTRNISYLLPDALHFSGEGYKVFFKEVKNTFKSEYFEEWDNGLERFYPTWDQLAGKSQQELEDILRRN
jgi:lysophospholipase L1-like esterase